MTNISLLEIIPGRPFYIVSLIILTLIILKILSVQRMIKTERILKKFINQKLKKLKFEEFPENKHDKLYNQLKEIYGFIDFNIVNRKNDTLLFKFNDSKTLNENNNPIKQQLLNYDIKVDRIKRFRRAKQDDLILCMNENLYLVFSFSKISYSQILEKN